MPKKRKGSKKRKKENKEAKKSSEEIQIVNFNLFSLNLQNNLTKNKLFNNVTGQNRLPPMNRLLGEIRSEGNDTTSYVETSPPNILRQKTGQGGHEEIADFMEKEYGMIKDEVIYTLDKISESCRLGNITIVEKARLKKLLLSSKEGIKQVHSKSITFNPDTNTCLICLETKSSLKGLSCCNSHFTCSDCLNDWVKQSTFESVEKARQSGSSFNFQDLHTRSGHIYCPAVASGNCNSDHYADHEISKVLSQSICCRFFTTLLYATETSKRIKETQEQLLNAMRGNGIDEKAVERTKINYAMKNALPNARMCKICFFGPIINLNCNDMAAHAHEANNNCPRCGWASALWYDYPLWDGRLPYDSVVLNDNNTNSNSNNDDTENETKVSGMIEDNLLRKKNEWKNNPCPTDAYTIKTHMGVGKLILARNDGVNVIELNWALANGAKARMYTRKPLLHLLEKKPLLVENVKAIQDTEEYIEDQKVHVKNLEQKLFALKLNTVNLIGFCSLVNKFNKDNKLHGFVEQLNIQKNVIKESLVKTSKEIALSKQAYADEVENCDVIEVLCEKLKQEALYDNLITKAKEEVKKVSSLVQLTTPNEVYAIRSFVSPPKSLILATEALGIIFKLAPDINENNGEEDYFRIVTQELYMTGKQMMNNMMTFDSTKIDENTLKKLRPYVETHFAGDLVAGDLGKAYSVCHTIRKWVCAHYHYRLVSNKKEFRLLDKKFDNINKKYEKYSDLLAPHEALIKERKKITRTLQKKEKELKYVEKQMMSCRNKDTQDIIALVSSTMEQKKKIDPLDLEKSTVTLKCFDKAYKSLIDMMEKNDAINKESALDRMLVKSCKSHVVFFNGESRKAIQDNKYNVNANVSKFEQETPLCTTAYHGTPDVTEFLLKQKGIDVNQRGKGGKTPLLMAISCGNVKVVQKLLEHSDITPSLVLYDSDGYGPYETKDLLGKIIVKQIPIKKNKKEIKKLINDKINSIASKSAQFKEMQKNLSIAEKKIPKLEDKLKKLKEEKIRLENMPLESKDWKKIKLLKTKTRSQHKMWAMEKTNNSSKMYEKGDIVILKTLKPHTEWLEGGINYSRRHVFRKERRRICVVQSVNYDEQTVKLLTDDHFSLNFVPMKRITPFMPLLGTCSCLKFQTDNGSVGYAVIGSSVNKGKKGDINEVILRSPLCPTFPNNKKDKSLSFVVLRETNLYKSRKMEEVIKVLNRGEIIKLTNEFKEDDANKTDVDNSIAISSSVTIPCKSLTDRILGHSGEWRDESKDAWCNRHSKKKISTCNNNCNKFHPVCCHGIAIIRQPHWSCCGVTKRYHPCRKPSNSKTNSLRVTDTVLATPWSENNLNKYASEIKDTDWLPGTILKKHDDGTFDICFYKQINDHGENSDDDEYYHGDEYYDNRDTRMRDLNTIIEHVSNVLPKYAFSNETRDISYQFNKNIERKIVDILNSKTFLKSLKHKKALTDGEVIGETKGYINNDEEETKEDDDDTSIAKDHHYNKLIGKRVEGKLRAKRWTRYFPGKIVKIIKRMNTIKFKIHFDDDERWVLQKDEILDFDKLLVKYGVVENKNKDIKFTVQEDLCMFELENKLHAADIKRNLIYMPNGNIMRIAQKKIPVDLVESHRNILKAKTKRIFLPQTWEEFSYQAQLILDTHKIKSAHVMKKDGREHDFFRATLLNKTTYSKALVRIQANDVIACHQFLSPQDATEDFPIDYVFMLGELVNCQAKKRKLKKKSWRKSVSKVGRIIGFETDGRLKIHIRNTRADMKRDDDEQKDETYRKDNWEYFSRDELSRYERDANYDSDDERALNEASDSGFTSEEEEE